MPDVAASPSTIEDAFLPFELSELPPAQCYAGPGKREVRMASFKLHPKWRVEQDHRPYGWLYWKPGLYVVADLNGQALQTMSGPKSMDAVTQPSRRARDFALRVLGVPPKG
ncbi:hypothetical protein L6R53_14070 [Myxococcota bacterium]|nr:hypothetical protein [Myxococcota bacterium]